MTDLVKRSAKPPTKATAKKVPAKKAPAKKAAAKKAAAKKASTKKVPRTASPSDPTMSRPALPAPPTDPLIVLGLAEPFSATQLRRAWRTYAARHHPDQGGDARTFDRGRGAYEALREGIS